MDEFWVALVENTQSKTPGDPRPSEKATWEHLWWVACTDVSSAAMPGKKLYPVTREELCRGGEHEALVVSCLQTMQ